VSYCVLYFALLQTDGLLRDVKLGRATDGATASSSSTDNSTTTPKLSIVRDVAYAPSNVRGEAKLPIPTTVSDSFFDDVNGDSSTDNSDTDGTDSDNDSSNDANSSDANEAPLVMPQPQLTDKQLRKQERQQKEQRLREALEAPGWTEAKLKMMSVSAAQLLLCTSEVYYIQISNEICVCIFLLYVMTVHVECNPYLYCLLYTRVLYSLVYTVH
jgi:hypothetical protein